MRDTHSIRWAIIALILGGIGTACTESSIISLLPDVGRHVGMTTESTLGYAITLYMVGLLWGHLSSRLSSSISIGKNC